MSSSECRLPSNEEREKLELCLYTLLDGDDAAYGLFFGRIQVRICDQPYKGFPAVIGMQRDGSLIILLCFELLKKLELDGIDALREILKHEVSHFIFGHVGSIGNDLVARYGDTVAGIAGDLVINQFIDVKKITTPSFQPVVCDRYKFKSGLSTEEYCRLLQTSEHPNVKADLAGANSRPYKLELIASDKDITTAEIDTMVVGMIEQIRQDEVCRKSRGWQSAEIENYVESLKRNAVIPWQALLRRKEGRHTSFKRTPTKVRPSRRNPQFYGRIRQRGLIVLFVADTSMSMGNNELRCIEPEVRGIANRGAKVYVMHVDAAVAKVHPYSRKEGIKHFFGGGGTNFTPAFDALTTLHPRPDFVVYFTDGFGEAPEIQPIDTLWVLTDTGMNVDEFRERVCPWGDIAVLNTIEGAEIT